MQYDNERLRQAKAIEERRLREMFPETSPQNPYSDMNPNELILMIETLLKKQEEMRIALAKESEENRKLLSDLVRLQQDYMAKLEAKDELIAALNKQIKDQNEAFALLKKNHFGSTSQKSKSRRRRGGDDDTKTPEEAKEDFNAAKPEKSAKDLEESVQKVEEPEKREPSPREILARQARRGRSINRMKADKKVFHRCDQETFLSLLPEGAEFKRVETQSFFDEERIIVEHIYDLVVYEMPDGTVLKSWAPHASGEKQERRLEPVEMVPGTQAMPGLMAATVFDRITMKIPAHRERQAFASDFGFLLSKQTLCNWMHVCATLFKPLYKALKDKCLEKNAIVNCDETWCRVRMNGRYRKTYNWCLVNKKLKIVIYCFEDGSRSRGALKHILGDAELKALQTDGYNVYMYLDDEISDIEHLCCMAHARAKFVYAADAGDKEAAGIVKLIDRLYDMEREYTALNLSEDLRKMRRNDPDTSDIVGRLKSEIDRLLEEDHPPRGELMDKAVNYMHRFWKQLFAYRNDGAYDIDNNLAERNIRHLANERKNILFFGSTQGARDASILNSFAATCKALGISFYRYLKTFLTRIAQGCDDFGSLMPDTISLA